MRPAIAVTAAMAAVLSLTCATAVRASTPVGVSDDGAMLAPGGVDWAAAHGFRTVRFQPHADDLARYDEAVARAQQLGLQVIVSPLGGADAAVEAAAGAAARWPGLTAVSAPNEPEIHGYDPCVYGRLYRRLRRAIPAGVPVLFGEFSPHGAWTYLKAISRCPAARTFRPRHLSFHPYQWATDPLSPKQLDSQDGHGDWLGIGRLPRVKRWLARRAVLRRFGLSRPPALWITEFGYLNDVATEDQVGRWWPRAIVQARRLQARVIVAQGAVTAGPGRRWDSSLPHGLVRTLTADP